MSESQNNEKNLHKNEIIIKDDGYSVKIDRRQLIHRDTTQAFGLIFYSIILIFMAYNLGIFLRIMAIILIIVTNIVCIAFIIKNSKELKRLKEKESNDTSF